MCAFIPQHLFGFTMFIELFAVVKIWEHFTSFQLGLFY